MEKGKEQKSRNRKKQLREGRKGPDLHDQHPDSISGSLAELQGLGGAHHDVDDGDHEPGQNEEGHQPVDVLYMLTCREPQT